MAGHPVDLLAAAAWQLAGSAPGTEPTDARWTDVTVPSTVASALRAAGDPVPDSAEVDGTDWWLRTTVDGHGPHLLTFEGLATVADVWLGDVLVLHTESMLRTHRVEVDLVGTTRLTVRCSAPLAWLGRRPRPRWKSTLVGDQRWRWLRTTVLGRITSWAGPVAPAGIWRPVTLQPLDSPVVARHRLAARLDGGTGVVDAELDVRGAVRSVALRVGESESTALVRGDDGSWRASVPAGAVDRWWPTGYGEQATYPITVELDGVGHHLGHVAFRTVSLDSDGFALRVNDVRVFARGSVWQPLDAVSFASDADAVRTALRTLRDGGHTLVRVPATGVYETDDFYAACDELGLLVWQDCMITTLDPPDTPEFHAELAAEVAELADRLAGRGCVAVVCGGAETEQQPAMVGLPQPTPLPVLTATIPDVLAQRLPDVPYVTGTPSGGALPMHTGVGVAQYFGVGAYLRPLADVRAAGVRFAGECLAFSVPPEAGAVRDAFSSPRVAGHDPRWKAAVPRDAAAGWDFEDVRDHYVAQLFDVDPRLVRYADPERYLDLGRAAVSTAMTEVLSWWRRPRSGCGGGIVLAARDLTPGAGWGLTDANGLPKSPWHALRPVLAPTALLAADDGGDGVTVTVVHDGRNELAGTLELRTFAPGGALLDTADVAVEVAPHGALEVGLDAALGCFTDANHYYRFGPRSRDAVHARLLDRHGVERARTTMLLGHHLRPPARLDASLVPADGGWEVALASHDAVQWLALECDGHAVGASWFHLAPGERRRVAVDPRTAAGTRTPQLTVRALNVAERTVPVADGDGTGVVP